MKTGFRHFASFLTVLVFLIIAFGSADDPDAGKGEKKSDGSATAAGDAGGGSDASRPSDSSSKTGDKTPQWICGIYVGMTPAYDMTGDDGKPVYIFGEKVRVPAVKKTIQIDRGGDTVMMREVSSEGTTVLSTAPLKITEASSSRVVVETRFENGSDGVPTQITITEDQLVLRQYKSLDTTLRRTERF